MKGFPQVGRRLLFCKRFLDAQPVGVADPAAAARAEPHGRTLIRSETILLPAERELLESQHCVDSFLFLVLGRHARRGVNRVPTVFCSRGSEGSRSGSRRHSQGVGSSLLASG